MEIEQSPQIIAKRMWKILRIVYHMVRKGISKSKLMLELDLHVMLKQGKVLGKAIENLMLQHQHHYAAFTCRPDDVHMSFVSPIRDYEFSCSNSPAPILHPSYHAKRNKHHHRRRRHNRQEENHGFVVERAVAEMLRNYHNGGSVEAEVASPLVALPGFGRSPMVRQLRVTDSPFSMKGVEENPQVDKDAEAFIEKFYRELKKERRVAALESPSPCHIWARRR